MSSRTKWEYKAVPCHPGDDGYWKLLMGPNTYDLDKGLVRLGEQSWELVAIQPDKPVSIYIGANESKEFPSYIYIFKRAKESW